MIENLKLKLIGGIPQLRERYLASLLWRLSPDETEIVFNKPILAAWTPVSFGRHVANGRTVFMSVWVCGHRIQSEQMWQFVDD